MNKPSPTAVFVVATVLVLVALFVSGPVGGVLLLLVTGVAAALLFGTWERLPLVGRVARVLVLALLLIMALKRLI